MTTSNGAANLTPAGPENTRALKHGIWSARTLEPRVQEVAEQILAAPHVAEQVDEIGAVELARLEVLIERMDEYLADEGLTNRKGDPRAMIDLRLRASRRLTDLLDRYGLNPLARSVWARALAEPTFAERVEQRLREIDR